MEANFNRPILNELQIRLTIMSSFIKTVALNGLCFKVFVESVTFVVDKKAANNALSGQRTLAFWISLVFFRRSF